MYVLRCSKCKSNNVTKQPTQIDKYKYICHHCGTVFNPIVEYEEKPKPIKIKWIPKYLKPHLKQPTNQNEQPL